MSKARFSITYEIITPESAKEADAAERGFKLEDVSFSEARNFLRWEGNAEEADSSPIRASDRVRWITFGADIDFRTAAETRLSLHIPETVSDASSRRIARAFGLRAG